MTSKIWPLGASERPRSQAELLRADTTTLRTWLHLSLLSFEQAANDSEKVRAFSPLVLSPWEDVERQLAAWWGRGDAIDRLRIATAISDEMESFDPAFSTKVTILLTAIGAHVGCVRGLQSIFAMLAKPLRVDSYERRTLSEGIAFFAARWGKNQEFRELAYRLRDLDMLTSVAAVELLVRAPASDDASRLSDIALLVPELLEDLTGPNLSQYHNLRRHWANSFVDVVGVQKAFAFGLYAQSAGSPELREALEYNRVKPLPAQPRQSSTQLRLLDRVRGTECFVDVSQFDRKLVDTPGSSDATEKRFAEEPVDSQLGLERFN